MKTLSPTQHACLDAMGIDVWVPRDELTESAEAVISVEQTINQIAQTSVSQSNTIESKAIDIKPIESKINSAEPASEEVASQFDIPDNWSSLSQAVSNCQHCALSSSRTQTVFGAGNQNANWLVIGDTPTLEDDKNGNPFTGQSGDLLTAMLRAIKLTRQQVYITNTLKCTTPNNREPEAIELETCMQYLHQQIALLKPKLILILGQSAAQRILNTHSTLARLRQKIHTLEGSNIPVIVTYHPASLLSMPANKGKAWQDLLFATKTISTEAVL